MMVELWEREEVDREIVGKIVFLFCLIRLRKRIKRG